MLRNVDSEHVARHGNRAQRTQAPRNRRARAETEAANRVAGAPSGRFHSGLALPLAACASSWGVRVLLGRRGPMTRARQIARDSGVQNLETPKVSAGPRSARFSRRKGAPCVPRLRHAGTPARKI
jgi:hypothetical protein